METKNRIYLNQLFDLYGPLLTLRAQEIYRDHYFLDLSLTEIGDNYHISKQAISETIKKVEKKLLKYEEKLGFNQRLGDKHGI